MKYPFILWASLSSKFLIYARVQINPFLLSFIESGAQSLKNIIPRHIYIYTDLCVHEWVTKTFFLLKKPSWRIKKLPWQRPNRFLPLAHSSLVQIVKEFLKIEYLNFERDTHTKMSTMRYDLKEGEATSRIYTLVSRINYLEWGEF